MPISKAVGRTTRDYLREATADSHERLDLLMGELVVDDEAAYAKFLQIQWHARVGVENWLQESHVEAMPPHQTDLIARDLAALRCALPDNPPAFVPSADADPMGTVWVLAGSSLGNRALLKRLKKTGTALPTSFLSDPRMVQFWQDLRPALERPHSLPDDQAVLMAAQATFAHFQQVAINTRVIEPA